MLTPVAVAPPVPPDAPAPPAASIEEGGAAASPPPRPAGAASASPAPPEGRPPAAEGSPEPLPPPAPPAAFSEQRRLELLVGCIQTAEAMRIMLKYVYAVGTGAPWEYQPSSAEVNKDVLRLARHFELPHLHELAVRWFGTGLTTDNVVERLATCEEFGLGLLRDKILEQLT